MPKSSSEQPVRRTTVRSEALVAAVAVALWILLGALLSTTVSVLTLATSTSGLYELESFGPLLAQQVGSAAGCAGLVGLGVFLSLWLIAPIWEGLVLRQVVVRSIVATAVSVGLAVIVKLVIDIVTALAFDRPLFSNSFPEVRYDGPEIVFLLTQALQSVIGTFFSLVPVLLAACLLLWQWCKAHSFAPVVAGVLED